MSAEKPLEIGPSLRVLVAWGVVHGWRWVGIPTLPCEAVVRRGGIRLTSAFRQMALGISTAWMHTRLAFGDFRGAIDRS